MRRLPASARPPPAVRVGDAGGGRAGLRLGPLDLEPLGRFFSRWCWAEAHEAANKGIPMVPVFDNLNCELAQTLKLWANSWLSSLKTSRCAGPGGDLNDNCAYWASVGECDTTGFMVTDCWVWASCPGASQIFEVHSWANSYSLGQLATGLVYVVNECR